MRVVKSSSRSVVEAAPRTSDAYGLSSPRSRYASCSAFTRAIDHDDVVELRRLPRLAGVGKRVGIAGGVERRARDLVHADVVGVRVEVAVVAVGDDHLRPLGADDLHEPLDRFVERRVREVVGAGVRLGVGHARVAVAEHVQRRVADRVDARRAAPPCAPRARLARTSGVSTAGLRMSPSSPPVQHTSTLRTPSAAYLAVVPAPFDASSSGCAWTWSRQRSSAIPARYRSGRRARSHGPTGPVSAPGAARRARPRRCPGSAGIRARRQANSASSARTSVQRLGREHRCRAGPDR